MHDPSPHPVPPIPSGPADLMFCERLLLGASRIWVQSWLNGANALSAAQRFFRFYEIEPAAICHSKLMHGVFVGADRPIEINEPNCMSFAQDEARIVHAVACVQSGRPSAAIRILEKWQTSEAARVTAPTLVALSDALAAKQIWAPLRPWRTEPPVRPLPAGLVYAPTSQRVH